MNDLPRTVYRIVTEAGMATEDAMRALGIEAGTHDWIIHREIVGERIVPELLDTCRHG